MSRIVKSWHTRLENTGVTIENSEQVLVAPVPDVAEDTPQKPLLQEPKINIEEVKRQAQDIIEKAKAESQVLSDDIIQEAQEKAEIIRREAIEYANDRADEIRQQAYQEGYDSGITSAKEEADAIIASAEEIKFQAHIYKDELIQKIEPEMIELITSVLDSLVEAEKEINSDAISILIKNGLGRASSTDDIIVHVSAEDYPNIDEAMILSSMENMANVRFVEDPTLKNLDCIIETGLGNIDCGLDTQYKSLRKNLHYILKNR